MDGPPGLPYNDWTQHFVGGVADSQGFGNLFGNPTPTQAQPLVEGDQFSEMGGGQGKTYFFNARWVLSANAMYQLPWGLEIAGSLYARQGFPFVTFLPRFAGADGSLRTAF